MTADPIHVERVRHELRFRIAEVVSAARLTPKMIRVTFESPELEGFLSLGYDDHVKLFFPAEDGQLIMPVPGPNGATMPEGVPRPESRDYTPRFFEAGTNRLTIDFVVHGEGTATRWAESAKPGDQIAIGGPRASFVVKGDADFFVLIGDETALPAIGRRIEELPAAALVFAFIEVADAREHQAFDTSATLNLQWVERNEVGAGLSDALLEAVRTSQLPSGDGYAFIAGESAVSKQIRTHLVDERGMPADRVKAAGYWQLGEEDFDDGHEH